MSDKSHQWSKFWWQDYLNDVELSSCSLAAQGLWMRMLCLMHRSGGYLLVAGKAPTDSELAGLVGAQWRQVKALLDELLRRQVCSKNAAGIIHNRRMIRAMEASEEGARNAKKRWDRPKTDKEPSGSPDGSANGENRKTPMLEAEAEAEAEADIGKRRELDLGIGREIVPLGESVRNASYDASPPSTLACRSVVDAWNAMARGTGLPLARSLTGRRTRQLHARLREHTAEEVCEAIRRIGASAFCRGENDRGWRADFDFLLQEKSLSRALEGGYDTRKPEPKFRNGFAQTLWDDAKHGAPIEVPADDGEDFFNRLQPEEGENGKKTVAAIAGPDGRAHHH